MDRLGMLAMLLFYIVGRIQTSASVFEHSPLPEFWVLAGCLAVRVQDGAVPGCVSYPFFIQLT